MPGGYGEAFGQGQKEIIRRGERTGAARVANQALGLFGFLTVATLAIEGFVLWYTQGSWRYIWRFIVRHTRGLLVAPAIFLVLTSFLGALVMAIEMVDPNYPNPRKAMSSTRVLWPFSKERGGSGGKVVQIDRDTLLDLLDALEEEED